MKTTLASKGWREELRSDPTMSALSSLHRAKRKRRAILIQLKQREHLGAEAAMDYGSFNPFHVPLAQCDDCWCDPDDVRMVQTEPERWLVTCPSCRKSAPEARKYAWAASLAWNQINLGGQDYEDLPLFGLQELALEDARKRMVVIRENLELRVALAHAERSIAKRDLTRDIKPPGRNYQRKLEAYLAWAMLAARLISDVQKSHNGD